jgi:hypothetical protein
VDKNFGFQTYNNRSVPRKTKNRRVRFRFFGSVFGKNRTTPKSTQWPSQIFPRSPLLAVAPPACPPIHRPPQITPLPQPQILTHRPPQHPPAAAGTPAGGRRRPQLLTCSPVHRSPQVSSSPRPPPAVDPPAGTPVADPPAGMPAADPLAPVVPPAAAAPLVCAAVDAPSRLLGACVAWRVGGEPPPWSSVEATSGVLEPSPPPGRLGGGGCLWWSWWVR